MSGVKRILDGMSMLKMNALHMHLTDDQGWRIEIKKYPNFTVKGSTSRGRAYPWSRNEADNTQYGPFFYTQEEMKELIRYAERLGITIVPEIEMPGHALSGVAAYPELCCLGKGEFEPSSVIPPTPNIEVYCPGNDHTLNVLEDVLDEIIELFPSQYIHVGGDECLKTRWKECEKCQKRMKDEGLQSPEELQSWFTQHMANYLESKGRHLIGWDEILEGGLANGAAVMSWRGTEGGTAAAAMGHQVVMAPDTYCYLDWNQFPSQDIYEYICCFQPLYHSYTYEPFDGLPVESRKYVIGVQGCSWSAYVWGGDYDLQYKTFPRLCSIAEIGWSREGSKSWVRFLTASIRGMRKRFELSDINAAPLALGPKILWTPEDVSSEYVSRRWLIGQAVADKGTYGASFVFTGGKNSISVKNVKILFDDKVVAIDDHEAVADWENTGDNTWRLEIEMSCGAEAVYLQADIKGIDGTDSYGEGVVYSCG